MIRLFNRQYDTIYQSLQNYEQQIVNHKYPCSDGGWIHYRIIGKEHMDDIEKMIDIKCSELS